MIKPADPATGPTLLIAVMSCLIAGCATNLNLTGCANPIKVDLPREFHRAVWESSARKEENCVSFRQSNASPSSYECFFLEGASDRTSLHAAINAWTSFLGERAGDQKPPWMAVRSKVRGADVGFKLGMRESIRRFEPSAPSDDAALEAQYPQLFTESAESATWPLRFAIVVVHTPRPFTQHRFIVATRMFNVHDCLVSVDLFVPNTSPHPVQTLNSFLERTSFR
jgi:hypothetical protein